MINGPEIVALAMRPPVIPLWSRLPTLEAPAVQALGLHDGQVVRPTVEVREGLPRWVLQGHVLVWPPPGIPPVESPVPMWVRLLPSGGAVLEPVVHGRSPESTGVQARDIHPVAAAAAPLSEARGDEMPDPEVAVRQLWRPGLLLALFQANPQPGLEQLLERWRQWLPSAAQPTPDRIRQWLQPVSARSASLTGPAVSRSADGSPVPLTTPIGLYTASMSAADDPDLAAMYQAAGQSVRDGQVLLHHPKMPLHDAVSKLLTELLQRWTRAPDSTRHLLQSAQEGVARSHEMAVYSVATASPDAAPPSAPLPVGWWLQGLVPFVDAEPVDMRVGVQERSQDGQPPAVWVDMHSAVSDGLEYWVHLQLEGRQKIDMTLWTREAEWVEHVRQGQSELIRRWQGAGFSSINVQVVHGTRPGHGKAATVAEPPGRWVDIQA